MKSTVRALRSRVGFTLLEVLVVMLVVILLFALIVPTTDRRSPRNSIHCLNNLKQMNLAWIMYASDSGDKLITNRPYASSAELPLDNWVAGVMDWSANLQNTNSDLLLAAALSVYLKAPGVYRCPADKSESPVGPRVRSYSMNGFLGNYSDKPAFPGWKQCLKISDLSGPATIFVFADEHANSIDDGFFINNPNQTNVWFDLPAANHIGAAGFGFADGHSEIHRWKNANTKQPVKPSGAKPIVRVGGGGGGEDLAWVLSAMATRDTNSVNEPPK